MIKDIYSRSIDSNNYSSERLEVDDALGQLIIKIENTLFTNRTEVLGVPEFGASLDELIFSLVLNESVIEERINKQIYSYCTVGDGKFDIQTKVKFYSTPERDGAFIDIFINEQRVIGALF